MKNETQRRAHVAITGSTSATKPTLHGVSAAVVRKVRSHPCYETSCVALQNRRLVSSMAMLPECHLVAATIVRGTCPRERSGAGISNSITNPRLFALRHLSPCVCGRSDFCQGAKTPSFGEVVICLGAVHMEEEVQDRVQVEVGREEQGKGETDGKEQGEEQRENRRSINRTSWMTMEMTWRAQTRS